MKKTSLLGLVIALAFGMTACDKMGGGKDARDEAKAIVDKVFAPGQYAVDFGKARKFKSGMIKIKNFSMTPVMLGKKLEFDEVIISNFDNKNPNPHHYKITMNGLTIKEDMYPNKMIPLTLKNAGIEKLVLDMDINHKYDAASKGYKFGANVTVRNLAEIRMDFNMTDIDAKVLDPKAMANQANARQVLSTAKIASISISLRNINLIQTISKKMSPQAIEAAKANIQRLIAASKDPLKVKALTAVHTFLTNKGAISLGINPDAPMPLMALINPANRNPANMAGLIKKLNITVVAQ